MLNKDRIVEMVVVEKRSSKDHINMVSMSVCVIARYISLEQFVTLSTSEQIESHLSYQWHNKNHR